MKVGSLLYLTGLRSSGKTTTIKLISGMEKITGKIATVPEFVRSVFGYSATREEILKQIEEDLQNDSIKLFSRQELIAENAIKRFDEITSLVMSGHYTIVDRSILDIIAYNMLFEMRVIDDRNKKRFRLLNSYLLSFFNSKINSLKTAGVEARCLFLDKVPKNSDEFMLFGLLKGLYSNMKEV